MFDMIFPFVIIFAGFSTIVIYVLSVAVKQLANQMTKTNERLMVMLAAQAGNDNAARGLVAMSRPPQGKASPKSGKEKKDTNSSPKSTTTVTMGVR